MSALATALEPVFRYLYEVRDEQDLRLLVGLECLGVSAETFQGYQQRLM